MYEFIKWAKKQDKRKKRTKAQKYMLRKYIYSICLSWTVPLFALHNSAVPLVLQLLLTNTLLGNAWHFNFCLGIRLCFETSTQTNTQRTLLLYFTQEKYTGKGLNHEGKQTSPYLYCHKRHSIDENSSRGFMAYQYFNKKASCSPS